jgi:hypothetical protein
MMDFELKLEKPTRKRAYISALTMGASYFIGRICVHLPRDTANISRWPHPDDSLLRDTRRQPRALRLHWHHGHCPARLRSHQELVHNWYDEVCSLRSFPDSSRWERRCWGELRNRSGRRQQESCQMWHLRRWVANDSRSDTCFCISSRRLWKGIQHRVGSSPPKLLSRTMLRRYEFPFMVPYSFGCTTLFSRQEFASGRVSDCV